MTRRKTELDRIIETCGGVVAFAKRVRVSRQTVRSWHLAGRIPADRLATVVHALDGAVTAGQLRPDIAKLFGGGR